MAARSSLRERIAFVVDGGNCSGCGGCTLLDEKLTMSLSQDGFARPTWLAEPASCDERSESARVARFERMCPGVSVRPPDSSQVKVDPVFGPVVEIWKGWALDSEVRSAGSSGGVLTALGAWLLDSGAVRRAFVTVADPLQPIQSRQDVADAGAEVLASAGSRYAPAAIDYGAGRFAGRDSLLIGRPCEMSASRGMETGDDAPIRLSFFCAGVPSQWATNSLVESLGVDAASVRRLSYRGGGWPGQFEVSDMSGRNGNSPYEESWGQHLGPTIQRRCKICVDGTGEAADIAAGDFWKVSATGEPSFEESPGVSVVIARTLRGREVLRLAREEGILHLEPADVKELYPIQPHQRNRRTTLFGRLIGSRVAGSQVPSYKGYRLWRFVLTRPVANARAAVGSFRRERRR